MFEPPHFALDRDKLKQLVLYVCHRKRETPKQLGKTKLHKILYYSDFNAYLLLNKPITGERYIKMQYGPFADGLDDILRELREEGSLIIVEEPFSGGDGKHVLFFVAEQPDISNFTPQEISIIDHYIEQISPLSATAISEISHDIVWRSSELFDEIPYQNAFLYNLGEIRPEDVAWARGEIALRT